MAYLEIKDLQVAYEKGNPVLDEFNLSIDEGQLVSLLGPSGCGKTTTLRSVAGFIEQSKGEITIGGEDITGLPPNKRDIGLVFQTYALFPHLTVFENVAFGLKMRGMKGDDLLGPVEDALKMVDLGGLEYRRPGQLSGGQRQRVAVARSIVIKPKLLLFDEPLSNLDAKLRNRMRAEIRQLQQQLGITTLYVTHDQVEALAISDRVIVMNLGKIEQDLDPERLYNHPATPFVADFMGYENHFDATVESVNGEQAVVQAGSFTFSVALQKYENTLSPGDKCLVYFRPDAGALSPQESDNSVPGKILVSTFHGKSYEYIVETPLGEFMIHQWGDDQQPESESIYLSLKAQNLLALAAPA
jgi:putative spermidine/putrescine transport system ATP-binding protein